MIYFNKIGEGCIEVTLSYPSNLSAKVQEFLKSPEADDFFERNDIISFEELPIPCKFLMVFKVSQYTPLISVESRLPDHSVMKVTPCSSKASHSGTVCAMLV